MATQLGNAAVIWSTAEVERLWPLEAAQRTPPLHIRCCRLIHNRAQRIRTLCSFSLTRSAMTFPVLCEPQMCLLNSFCLPTSALSLLGRKALPIDGKYTRGRDREHSVFSYSGRRI